MSEDTKEPELLDGVQILLDRMEMFPEEFVSDNYGGAHKWNAIFDFGWNSVLNEHERSLLEAGLKKATRKVFSQRVATHVMYLNGAVLHPQRELRPTAKSRPTFDVHSLTAPSPALTATQPYIVADGKGNKVIMHKHEYDYYMKQPAERQISYLDWIRRGRP
jgi:hypothetical protein